ncbi:hypothetical protein JOF36_001351 [Pseudonocardia parietis]|uniref:Uncharacterized protein n=1 Tax=Pseudonocardia parietis TaxID=570936 RepID=A0ABS4VP12_9PSEU|nr:hypothetical protein [Pseudonocardia parietis]
MRLSGNCRSLRPADLHLGATISSGRCVGADPERLPGRAALEAAVGASFHLPEAPGRTPREAREMCLRTLVKTAAA